ncbi:MAG: DUF5683 domain-containing protein [Mucilaginibacter sp.]|uniref:DUF5683 domain-containing protein n=1 Tax=Mucilaginibacter sp. TaxID=1882438 RepID=UPI0031A37D29
MHRYIVTFLWLSTLTIAAFAQTGADSLSKRYPSGSFAPPIKEKRYHPDSTHRPHTAVMRSLFLPGLGQLYNHRWWKLPIIYGGLGLMGSAAIANQKQYNRYSALAILQRDVDPSSPKSPHYALYKKYKTDYKYFKDLPPDRITGQANYFQRYRDLSILGVLAFWTINTLDAYIDAKFINSFSVDNNLSINPVSNAGKAPAYAASNVNGFNPGLRITFVMR